MSTRIDDDIPYDIQERTFRFSVLVVRLCQALSGAQDVRRVLARQLLQSATSIGANMEEADAGQTKPDFIGKVAIARKEAKETIYSEADRRDRDRHQTQRRGKRKPR